MKISIGGQKWGLEVKQNIIDKKHCSLQTQYLDNNSIYKELQIQKDKVVVLDESNVRSNVGKTAFKWEVMWRF